MLWLSPQSSTTTNIRWWSDYQIIRLSDISNLGFWCLQIIRSKYLPLDQHWERGVASVVDFSSVLYLLWVGFMFICSCGACTLPFVTLFIFICSCDACTLPFVILFLFICSKGLFIYYVSQSGVPAWQCPIYRIHWKQNNSFFWSFMICGGLVNNQSNIWWWPPHQKLCRQRGMVGERVSDGLEQSKAFERILRLNKCISKSLVL